MATTAIVLTAAGLWLWRARTTPPPAKSQALAVMYFTNLTQDRSLDWLDRGLCEMLTTNLSQVKGLDVLSTERIAAVLDRIGKKELTPKTAPEVARNAGAAAFVTGALMRVGPDSLRLDVRAQDASGGQVLFSERVEGEDVKAVFKMVDALTARMAERLLPSGVLPGKAPVLEEVTTSNAEAFRHYQLGLDAQRKAETSQAQKEYEEAVRLDPQFASAWFALARQHSMFGSRQRAYEILRDLEAMRSRLPRRIQLALPGVRAHAGRDYDEVERTFSALLNEFPRETEARELLANSLRVRDRFDKAVELLEEGLRLDPNDYFLWAILSHTHVMAGNPAAALEANGRERALLPGGPISWDDRGAILFTAGRDDEAIAALQKSIELAPAAFDYFSLAQLIGVYADQKKFALAESTLREYGRLSGNPRILFHEAQLEEARGRPEAARELYRKAVGQLAAGNYDEWAGQALQELAQVSQLLGESSSTLAFARRQKLNGEELVAISYLEAVEGDAAASERSLQRYATACPWWTPAALQMFRARNQMAAAIQRQDAATARQFTARQPTAPLFWLPFYEARMAMLRNDFGSAEQLLGRALLSQRWLNLMVNHQHLRSPLVTLLCHFYLGQVYEATGRRDQAIAEYREFLSVFDGSATRLPQVAAARAALKRLGTP